MTSSASDRGSSSPTPTTRTAPPKSAVLAAVGATVVAGDYRTEDALLAVVGDADALLVGLHAGDEACPGGSAEAGHRGALRHRRGQRRPRRGPRAWHPRRQRARLLRRRGGRSHPGTAAGLRAPDTFAGGRHARRPLAGGERPAADARSAWCGGRAAGLRAHRSGGSIAGAGLWHARGRPRPVPDRCQRQPRRGQRGPATARRAAGPGRLRITAHAPHGGRPITSSTPPRCGA